LESKIERKFTEWCEKHGITSWKFTSPGRNGVPDHVFHYDGLTAYIEFKQPGHTPTELQWEQIKILESQDIPVNWFGDVDDAKEWLNWVFDLGLDL
jgi:hypothetical protein